MKKKTLLPDEENARLTVERFREINGRLSAEKAKVLRVISSHSRFLGNSIIRNPRALNVLTNEKSLGRKKNAFFPPGSACLDCEEFAGFRAALRAAQGVQVHGTLENNLQRGSGSLHVSPDHGGDFRPGRSVVRAVLDFYRSRIEGGDQFEFVVLGMGKLGGRLLNLSSDIDLIYLYRSEDYAEQIFTLSSSVTRTISSVTPGGFLYRVDLGLRPGGSRSPVAVSVDAALEHYYHWAETWERAVLLKASPVAGDIELGREFLGELEPVIYRKLLDYESIEDLKDMKVRLEGIRKENDVKLGRGGIRDIEFFVQATQLMSGGAVKKLRGLMNTLDGLSAMETTGFITKQVKEEMERCYLFLRKVEHSIQLWDELQTHSIPTEESSLARLSRRMGFEKTEDFRAAYEEVALACREELRKPFLRPRGGT